MEKQVIPVITTPALSEGVTLQRKFNAVRSKNSLSALAEEAKKAAPDANAVWGVVANDGSLYGTPVILEGDQFEADDSSPQDPEVT